jgi:hypothetical protein
MAVLPEECCHTLKNTADPLFLSTSQSPTASPPEHSRAALNKEKSIVQRFWKRAWAEEKELGE